MCRITGAVGREPNDAVDAAFVAAMRKFDGGVGMGAVGVGDSRRALLGCSPAAELLRLEELLLHGTGVSVLLSKDLLLKGHAAVQIQPATLTGKRCHRRIAADDVLAADFICISEGNQNLSDEPAPSQLLHDLYVAVVMGRRKDSW